MPRPASPLLRRTWRAGPLAIAVSGCIVALHGLGQHRAPLGILWGPWLPVLAVTLAAGSGLGAVLLAAVVTGRRDAERAGFRPLLVLSVLGGVAYLAALQPFSGLTARLTAGVVAATFVAGAARRWRDFPPRAELVAFNLCLALVGVEAGLKVIARVTPSAYLTTGDTAVSATIEQYRSPPGHLRWGFPCNASGHYDAAFLGADARERPMVAMVGDSFSAGVVPHAFHFTTVAERLLGDVEVYNFGMPAIGPEHYLHLLATEVMAVEPDAVVVDIFVGNDVMAPSATSSDALRAWLDRDHVVGIVFARRWLRAARERAARGGADAGSLQDEAASDVAIPTIAELERRLPWLHSPGAEQPTFSNARYLEIEFLRATAEAGRAPEAEDALLDLVARMRALAAPTPLAVMLIPDVFQVDDALWARLEPDLWPGAERHRSQRTLTAMLRARGIPVLDLLPALRAVPPGPDGSRHLYKANDTHFNARGNRVAAEALATFLPGLYRR